MAEVSEPLGVTSAYSKLLVGRTAAREAAFLVPYLQPGMRLLDCGCGHGTITLGLAALVAPGAVVGIDLDEARVAAARVHAADQGVTNVEFRVGDLRQIPFPDESFDAAFEHAVLMYLQEPVTALREIRRVLKPGGVFGARDTDFAATFSSNLDALLAQSLEIARSWYARRGTNLEFGRQLRGLLGRAGFRHITASASCDTHGTPEALEQWADTWVRLLSQPDLIDFSIQSGLATGEKLQQMCAAVRSWGKHPDSFHAAVMGEAVGWK